MSNEYECVLFEAAQDACGVTGEPCNKSTEEEIKNCEIKKNMYEELK
ncbi:MAG: hypothetical protein ACXQS8_06070 [Candidatus Helarchaeales archaeon]